MLSSIAVKSVNLVVISLIILLCSSVSWGIAFITPGSEWKYLDNGSDQGTAWRDTIYNDSGWSVGTAELGFGDSGNGRPETTQITSGYTTYYFRHSFSITTATSYTNVYLGVLRDDGAVVYLNGTEIFRTNMPAGNIYATTFAFSNVSSSDETTYFTTTIDTALLVEGDNLITAEVHQNAMSSGDLSFDLWLSTSTTFTSSTLLINRGPYLQLGTPTSIHIRWRTPEAATSQVNYGTTLGNLTAFMSSDISTTEHELILSGLSANTKYYYAIGTIGGTIEGDDAAHCFVTFPTEGTAKRSRIWVISDVGYGSASQKAVFNGYLTYTGSTPTDLWLTGGDNSQTDGLDTQYQTEFFDIYTTLFRKSVIWPSMGNHDARNSVSSTETGPYFDMLSLPRNGEAGGITSGTEAYYSFNYGRIHFVCLNSANVDQSSTGPMLTWLKNDLAANTQDWLIAYWHHPPYYNSDSMRQNAVPILEDGGVDLVFSGHDHSYRRTDFIDGHYGTTLESSMIVNDGNGRIDGDGAYAKPYGGATAHQGAMYMVVGTGGSSGSMVLDIDKNQLDVKYITTTGTISDYFTIVKDTATNPKVNAITRLDANPSGNATTIRFLVDLNHSVTGIDTSDLVLSVTGVSDAAIISISGSGSQYMVTVYTGIGSGTIRLDLNDNDSIKNGVNVPLGGSGVGNGDYTSGEVYTILSSNNPPEVVTLLDPGDGSNMFNHIPAFIWTETTDSNPGDIIQYLLQVSTTSTFNTIAYDSGYSSSTTATPISELATGQYYWRVISRDTSFAANTSVVWIITLLNRPPTASVLLAPSVTTTNNRVPTFIWSAASDPDLGDTLTYTLQVGTDSSFSTGLAINTSGVTDTTYTVLSPLSPDYYYWQVVSVDPTSAKNTSQGLWFIAFDTTQQRVIDTVGTTYFYLGTWNSSTDYTPVTMGISSCLGIDTITINVYDAKHPNANDSSNKLSDQYFLSRWYTISSEGNIPNTMTLTFTYTDADFIDAQFGLLAEDQIRIAKYSASSTWSWFSPQSIDTATNRVQLNGITSFSDWTLSGPYGVPVELSRFDIETESEGKLSIKK
ncbi:MAG: metallophosphoesterase [bacterium]